MSQGWISRIVGRLFDALRQSLVPLAAQIADRPALAPAPPGPFPVEQQRSFGESVAIAAGFDRHRGRFDLGIHPSCNAIGPGDCRLVLRFDQGDFAAECSPSCTRSVTGSTSRDWTRATMGHRWVSRRPSQWTRPRRGSGKIAWDGVPGSGATSILDAGSCFPMPCAGTGWTALLSRSIR